MWRKLSQLPLSFLFQVQEFHLPWWYADLGGAIFSFVPSLENTPVGMITWLSAMLFWLQYWSLCHFGFFRLSFGVSLFSLEGQSTAGWLSITSWEGWNLWLALGVNWNHYFWWLVSPFLGLVYSKFLWLKKLPRARQIKGSEICFGT